MGLGAICFREWKRKERKGKMLKKYAAVTDFQSLKKSQSCRPHALCRLYSSTYAFSLLEDAASKWMACCEYNSKLKVRH